MLAGLVKLTYRRRREYSPLDSRGNGMKSYALTIALVAAFFVTVASIEMAFADSGKNELKDDFTGIYSLDKNSGSAILRKTAEGQYLLSIDLANDINFDEIKVETAPNGTLIGSLSDDCDDPGCTSTDGEVTILRAGSEAIELTADYDWYQHAGGDEEDIAGNTSLHGVRLKQLQ